MTRKTFVVDAATNRLTSSDGCAMTYDAAGNQTYDCVGTHYYDAENRMTKAVQGSSNNYYFYDASGKRVRRILNGSQTWGGQETWFVYGFDGELAAEYAYNQVTAPLATAPQKEYGYRGGKLLVVWDGTQAGDDQLKWLVTDHLGSTRMEANKSGSLAGIRRHDYLPFGEELVASTGAQRVGIGYEPPQSSVRQRFGSKERDTETGLDYFGARYFGSVQGRFTSPDPLEFWMLDEKKNQQTEYIANPQRWNKYAYVLNNPLRYVDPNGLAEVPAWEKLDKTLQEDLAKRGVTIATWNKWNNDQRQEVLNNRAILMEAGVWGNVTSITFGTFTVVDKWGTAEDRTNFTPSTGGWALAITTDKDIQADLVKAGFKYESNVWNHPEGKWTLKQGGDDYVLHVVGLKEPSDKYMANHFDSGGGSIFNRKHFSDWWNNKGVTQDAVTRSLGGTPAASHLRGISPDIDKLLTQGKNK